MNKTFLESIIVGCIVMIIYKQIPLGTPFRVFLTGFIFNMLGEYSGVNRWRFNSNNIRTNTKTPGTIDNI